MKKILERLVLWMANHFRAERQMIPSLHTVPADKAVLGRMYEWYGRVVKAVRNPNEVKTLYYIWPNPNMSQRAKDLIINNIDRLQAFDTMYRTEDAELGEALKNDGSLEVSEEIKNKPCQMCCMEQNHLPCPLPCDFKKYWLQVAKYKQNCTDQEAYMRLMERKINRR